MENLTLRLSIQQMKKLKNPKVGSIIFKISAMLASLLAIGSLAGAFVSIAETAIDAKKNKDELAQQKRHNLMMESKSGKGFL